MATKCLLEISAQEQKTFFNSFDTVLCDCDGVLWLLNTPIDGVNETLNTLKQSKKNIHFISNNSIHGSKKLFESANRFDLKLDENDITIPVQAMIAYLKEINFNKTLFILGSSLLKQEFIDAGLMVANTDTIEFTETVKELVGLTKCTENIGAVIFDVDFELTYSKLLKCQVCLQDSEVLYLAGATDKNLPIGYNKFLMGPGHFLNSLQEVTGRTPVLCGKPSTILHKFVLQKYNIRNPSRVLFIGDSLEQDIKFGLLCGFQTLLVLTGVTKLEDLQNCKDVTKTPHYYANSISDLTGLLKNSV